MKIHLISIEDGLDNIGFRKLSGFIKALYPDTGIFYVTTGNLRSLTKVLTLEGVAPLHAEDIAAIAASVADADIVAFSAMTPYAAVTAEIIAAVRRRNPQAIVVWGGIHAIIDPNDAIKHADAVCTGEGEYAFQRFVALCEAGFPLIGCPGFWVRTPGGIVKHPNLPLMTQADLDRLPLPCYDDGELIYRKGKGFEPLRLKDFVNWCGLAYNTIWSIGCPLRCVYCGNSKFLEYDSNYRNIRYASPATIIREIKAAKSKHPHISSVVFHDDSFMALPKAVLEEFCALYVKEIGLPFAVLGLLPAQVTEEKMELLVAAGMNRVRMGIQSGSQRILDFYNRHASVERIEKSCTIIHSFRHYMIPPAYDIILDNPLETVEDTCATLDLLFRLPKPYTLNVFSLRIIPNTPLAALCTEQNIPVREITSSGYFNHLPTLGNILIYLIMLVPLPQSLFQRLRTKVKPSCQEQRQYPMLMFLVRMLYLTRRAIDHLRFMDFTVLTGWSGYILWRTGIIARWQRRRKGLR